MPKPYKRRRYPSNTSPQDEGLPRTARQQCHDRRIRYVLFEDGAQIESSVHGLGPLIEPPDDEWERAKLICQYYEILANLAEGEFLQFKGYLHGTGVCPAGVNTPAQKLAHLKKLKAAANTARVRYRKARREVSATTPAWLIAKQNERARSLKQRERFLDEVDRVEL